MDLKSIDEQIAAKWESIKTWDQGPFSQSDTDHMVATFLEVQELNAVKVLILEIEGKL